MQRFIDDTISFVKLGTMNYIITCEEEDKGTLRFLHALICRKFNSIVTIVSQEPTNNDIYLNWNAFAPGSWKRRT